MVHGTGVGGARSQRAGPVTSPPPTGPWEGGSQPPPLFQRRLGEGRRSSCCALGLHGYLQPPESSGVVPWPPCPSPGHAQEAVFKKFRGELRQDQPPPFNPPPATQAPPSTEELGALTCPLGPLSGASTPQQPPLSPHSIPWGNRLSRLAPIPHCFPKRGSEVGGAHLSPPSSLTPIFSGYTDPF